MVQTIIKKNMKELAKSDIVFCIDISDSMAPCIEGVKNNIRNFIKTIENDPEISIDWRLGLLAHSSNHSTIDFWIKDFTEDVGSFESAVDSLEVGSSEANLPALDWSLDLPWRADAHKFIIMFTDEPVDGGWNPEESKSKISELTKKIQDIGTSVYIVSFDSSEYNDYKIISKTDKCEYIPVSGYNGFENTEFNELLGKIGKKVSTNSRGIANKQVSVKKDIYGVEGIVNINKI